MIIMKKNKKNISSEMPQASSNASSTIFGSQKRTRVPPIVSGHVDTSTVAKLSPSDSFSDPHPPLRSGHRSPTRARHGFVQPWPCARGVGAPQPGALMVHRCWWVPAPRRCGGSSHACGRAQRVVQLMMKPSSNHNKLITHVS